MMPIVDLARGHRISEQERQDLLVVLAGNRARLAAERQKVAAGCANCPTS